MLLLKATEEMSCLFSRYVVSCFLTCSQPKSCSADNNAAGGNRFDFLVTSKFYVQGLISSLWRLRAILKLSSGFCSEDIIRKTCVILDLSEYCAYLASAWLQRSSKALILVVKPLLLACSEGHEPDEITMGDLKMLLHQTKELVAQKTLSDNTGSAVGLTKATEQNQGEVIIPKIPEEVRWMIIRAALWGHISTFLKYHLNSLFDNIEEKYSFGPFDRLSSSMPSMSETDGINEPNQMRLVSVVLAKLLKTTLAQISSSSMKHLASFLLQKMEDGSNEPTLMWLKGFSESSPRALNKHLSHGFDSQDVMNRGNDLSASELLWDFLSDPKFICERLEQQSFKWQQYIKPKPPREWSDMFVSVNGECKAEESSKQGGGFDGSETGSPLRGPSPDLNSFPSTVQPNVMLTEKFLPFQNPKEVHRRNGELLEVLLSCCYSS